VKASNLTMARPALSYGPEGLGNKRRVDAAEMNFLGSRARFMF